MIVAELDIFHSRPIAPTRRVALGRRNLPVEPVPGVGGVLLAGVVAHNAPIVEPELREDLVDVLDQLIAGERVVQPRVRHRFQSDIVGLTHSPQRLLAIDGVLEFDLEDGLGRPVQLALGAVYAAASLPVVVRTKVLESLRGALVWSDPLDSRFVSFVLDGRAVDLSAYRSWDDPVSWALETLGIQSDVDDGTPKRVVQRRFRTLLRQAHPDHGGGDDAAATRIADLTEARRILLAR